MFTRSAEIAAANDARISAIELEISAAEARETVNNARIAAIEANAAKNELQAQQDHAQIYNRLADLQQRILSQGSNVRATPGNRR